MCQSYCCPASAKRRRPNFPQFPKEGKAGKSWQVLATLKALVFRGRISVFRGLFRPFAFFFSITKTCGPSGTHLPRSGGTCQPTRHDGSSRGRYYDTASTLVTVVHTVTRLQMWREGMPTRNMVWYHDGVFVWCGMWTEADGSCHVSGHAGCGRLETARVEPADQPLPLADLTGRLRASLPVPARA